jgi:hypothetical protein
MSYEIVKRIVFNKDGEVWCSWDSNNVHPHDWTLRIWGSGTRMLRERGREYLDRFIIYNYWSGNMQPGNRNRYSNAADWFTRNQTQWSWRSNSPDWDCYKLFPGHDNQPERDAHTEHLESLHGNNITTTVDWAKPEFIDGLYQAYLERKKIPVAKIGDEIEFETPLNFSGTEKSRFELIRYGKKAVRFKDENGQLYNIRGWRDRPYKILS